MAFSHLRRRRDLIQIKSTVELILVDLSLVGVADVNWPLNARRKEN